MKIELDWLWSWQLDNYSLGIEFIPAISDDENNMLYISFIIGDLVIIWNSKKKK